MTKQHLIYNWVQNKDSFDPVPNYGNDDLRVIVYMDENKHRQDNKYVLVTYDGETLLKTNTWNKVSEYLKERLDNN